MNNDQELKIQAYLDGELSPRENEELKKILFGDKQADLLFQELRNTKAALSHNELEIKLPESRDFFWSKIEREIHRQEVPARPVAKPSVLSWLHRHLVPAAGVAAIVLIGVVTLTQTSNRIGTTSTITSQQVGEVESPSDEMGSFTFRSQSEKMTVVWLYDRSNSDVAENSTADNFED